MLTWSAPAIYLYRGAADMRQSFDGLSALVERAFPGALLSGSWFVFVNRRRTLVKVLCWQEDGLTIWAKRLEAGTFRVTAAGSPRLSRRELMLLLEGVWPRRLHRRYRVGG